LEFAVGSQTFADSAEAVPIRGQLQAAGKPLVIVPDAEFAKLTATENPQGILCIFRAFAEPAPAAVLADPFVLVLDRVMEPGNLGTILRTAWAVGLKEAWYTAGTTDPFGPKAVRAGMGAQFALALRGFADLAAARDTLRACGGGRFWCSVPGRGVDCFSAEFALSGGAVVIGNEANGVGEVEGAEFVTIPMPGQAESLNAAQAATILLFEAVRRGILK
jgi:TrmH family RNA methyltransferase